MNRKPTFAENLRRFVEGKGFYVVVLICVAAIGISGFYLVRSTGFGLGAPDDAPVSASASVTLEPTSSPSPSVSVRPTPSATAPAVLSPTPTPTVPAPSASVPASPSAPASPSPSAPSRPATLVYTWPVKGDVLTDFSLETLSYDETMGDWRVHSAIDIAAALGTTVVSTADGTVAQVYTDDLMGTTVVIDHGQGMVSTYSNLQRTPTVEEGDKVYTGSIIGSVGATAIAESRQIAHLHFELSKDGVAVDPELYLPQQR